jgi:hypothetical protein
LGLAPGAVIWASADCWAETPKATDINVAVSIDLMTNPGSIEAWAAKHI